MLESYFIKLVELMPAISLKRDPAQVFSSEIWKIVKSIFFTEQPVAAFGFTFRPEVTTFLFYTTNILYTKLY